MRANQTRIARMTVSYRARTARGSLCLSEVTDGFREHLRGLFMMENL